MGLKYKYKITITCKIIDIGARIDVFDLLSNHKR